MKSNRTVWWFVFVAVAFVASTLLTPPVYGIPAFARKYDKECSGCHNAWPMLNEDGQKFKENGYRFLRDEDAGQQKINDFLRFDQSFPVSAVLVGRPFDKKDSGDEKIRALHELEVMVAGQMSENFATFFELEAEDESGFEIEIPAAVFGYYPHEAFNVELSWSALSWMDPYDTYSDTRRLTRGHASVVDRTFGGVGDGLRRPRQNINIAGRAHDKVFYNVGLSGTGRDPEGENPNDVHGRVAVDVAPGAMLGFLAVKGKDSDQMFDYVRIGVDGQADLGDARVMGAFVRGIDDVIPAEPGGDDDVTNNAFYVQGMYVVKQDGRPTWVPLARIDVYEMADGELDYTELTLNLGYYFMENAKGFIEFWQQVSTPDGTEEDNRITLQVAAAF